MQAVYMLSTSDLLGTNMPEVKNSYEDYNKTVKAISRTCRWKEGRADQ